VVSINVISADLAIWQLLTVSIWRTRNQLIAGVKIAFEGKPVEADEMSFEVESETVGVYQVEGGVKIELRHVTSAIYRIKDRKAADGTQLYVVMGAATMTKTSANQPEAEPV